MHKQWELLSYVRVLNRCPLNHQRKGCLAQHVRGTCWEYAQNMQRAKYCYSLWECHWLFPDNLPTKLRKHCLILKTFCRVAWDMNSASQYPIHPVFFNIVHKLNNKNVTLYSVLLRYPTERSFVWRLPDFAHSFVWIIKMNITIVQWGDDTDTEKPKYVERNIP